MIDFQSLSFQYGRRQSLFSDFSLTLEPGCIAGMLGKNGAGKTTLLHLMGGLLQPLEGSLRVNGCIPFERNPAFLADVYLVPEEFSFPHTSIATYIKAFSPFYPSFDTAKMETILKEFQLNTAMQLNKISHGQRKKFLIAFALSTNCKLLMFDEPTNGLDIPSKSQFRKILVSSVSDDQVVIISTHQVKDIDTIIDRVLVVDEGQLIYHQSTAAIAAAYHFEWSEKSGDEGVLYSEQGIGGYRIIRHADGRHETPIDLEILFNAVTNRVIAG